MTRKTTILCLLLTLLYASGLMADETGYPGRSEYPDVLIYEKSELFAHRNDVVLVDTRSVAEFETIRINIV